MIPATGFNLNPANRYNFNYTVAAGSTGTCGPLACGTVLPVSIYANRTQTGASASTYAHNTPYPTFGSVTEAISNMNSSDHGLTVDVTKRASNYASFDANYTWSHALDFNQNQSTSPGTNNWYDPLAGARSNYGNSNLNVPQPVVGWAILNAPGLAGHGALTHLTNGWSVKPLVQVQSGLPYSVHLTGTVPNQCYVAGCFEPTAQARLGQGLPTCRSSGEIPSVSRGPRSWTHSPGEGVCVQREIQPATDRRGLQSPEP